MEKIELIKTGKKEIDNLISGFYASELVMIASRPGLGKTTLLCELAKNICTEHEGLFFTMQINKKMAYAKFLSCISRVPVSDILEQKADILDAEKIYKNLKIELFDDSRIKLKKLISIIRKKVTKQDVRIVFIDYLGFLVNVKSRKPLYEQYARAIKSLKLLAKELNIVIIITNPLSRTADYEVPNLGDIRGGGGTEDVCDLILFLHKDQEDTRKIIIAKNNRGNLGECVI